MSKSNTRPEKNRADFQLFERVRREHERVRARVDAEDGAGQDLQGFQRVQVQVGVVVTGDRCRVERGDVEL